MKWRVATFGWVTAGAIQIGVGTAAEAQRSRLAPIEARRLVVKITDKLGAVPRFASGVIVAADDQFVYIATVRHAVRDGDSVSSSLKIEFADGEGREVAATVLRFNVDLDLAALRVARGEANAAGMALPKLDRLGKLRLVDAEDPVRPVGCPGGECWLIGSTPDRVVGLDNLGMLFSSMDVKPGSSGGALFNADWEIIGLVKSQHPPRVEAVAMQLVTRVLRDWHVPVHLTSSSIPRAGYDNSLSIATLFTKGRSPPELGNDMPSGRIMIARRLTRFVSVHAAGLRLAPDNMTLDAATLGLSAHARYGRFSAEAFGEIGIGRTRPL